MPRIKIIKAPKNKISKFDFGGEDCDPGYIKDAYGNCVPDFDAQSTQQKFGTNAGVSSVAPSYLFNQMQTVQKPTKALAPALPGPVPSIQMPASNTFDIWGNPTDINGQSPNAMNMPKQTIVDANGNTTTKGVVDIGNPTLYEAQQTPRFKTPAKPKMPKFDTNQALNIGSAITNYVNTQKTQNRFNDWQAAKMLPDNFSAINKGSDRGWYDKNDGMYDPYKMGYKQRREYGGMIKAEEGVIVPGDQTLQAAFLPNVSTDVIGPTRSRSAASPEYSSAAPEFSTSEASANNEYVLPVKNFVLTSGFGTRKAPKGPKGPASTNHNGLDLAVPENTDVFAPMDGVVKSIYYNDQGGNQLVVQHPDGSRSGYAHLNGYKVKVGDQIGRGQVIALSGNTGNSNGAHLHFTWRDPSGTPIDPRNIFNFDTKVKNKTKVALGNQISLTHNNPLNVHYGSYAQNYGGVPGANDAGGKVAKFPDLQTGLQANKDLLFGPAYINLTIAEARNKWVSGSPSVYNPSTNDIIKAMGGNKKLSSLSSEERDKLFKEFARWEGSEAYNAIKNTRIFKEGGETNNNKNMKIRIVGGPEHMDKGGEPQYSGQSDYGLYIGQRDLYKTMAKSPYDDAGNNVQEQPESENNPHVLEAEGGETILRPDGTHMKISGRSHAQGGVKLTKEQAPEGSFIYSDTQKMKIKNPQVLGHFGKKPNNSGITPADIAKQYDVNKFMGILQNPNADYLSKQTAMKMVQNYQRKLAELALVQEGIKGFPQGIPEVAKSIVNAAAGPMQGQQGSAPQQMLQNKFGGSALHKFINGGPMDPEFLEAIKFMTDYEQRGSASGPNGYVGGGKNWGTNKDDITSQQQAIEYYYKNYWPMVKDLPSGLRTRALQMAVNTGDPYGELMTAASSFKGVEPMSPAERIATKDQRKDLSPDQFTGNDWNKRKDQVIAAYNSNPTEFMKNLDSEQNRYYTQGLNSGNNPQNIKDFHKGYYEGVGKIANKYIRNNNPLSDDPFGVKKMLLNAGSTNTKTGAPVSTMPTSSTPPAKQTVPKWFSPWLKSNTKAGRTSPTNKQTVFDPKDPNKFYQDYNRWKGIAQKEGVLKPGQEFGSAKQFQEFLYDYVEKNNPKALQDMWDRWGTTALGKTIPKEQRTKKAFADAFFGARTAELLETPETTTLPPPPPPTTTPPPTTVPPPPPPTTLPPDLIPPTTLPPGIPGRYGWTQQDIRNYMNAGADYATLKKYHPYSTRIQPVLPEFTPVDWRGQAAALQSSTNAAANQLGAYMPGQSMASNLSALTGQQAESLGKAISGVDQYNAAGASNMDLQRANMLNQFTQYNAQNTDKDFAEENVYDDRFRAAERLARKGIVKTRNQGEDTATKIYNLNQVESPYYQIDPYTQAMMFNDDAARAAWIAKNSGGYQAPAGSGAAEAKRYQEIYEGLAGIPEDQKADVAYKIWSGDNSSTRVKKREYPANINKNYNETTETKNKEQD